jgi:hypothetical protein
MPPVFIVAADESQAALSQQLARALVEAGIFVQGLEVISRTKEVKPVAPEKLGIRFGKGANDATFRTRLAETVANSTGRRRAWSMRQLPMALTQGTYEIWLPAIDGARRGRQ